METGGMKGRRKELVREELHAMLCQGFGVEMIHSEYGMTELLSQAYSAGKGIYKCVPWLKVLIRDTNDALSYLPIGKTGGINIIDLANRESCSFIATQDLVKQKPDCNFLVLGRFDNAQNRGCKFLIKEFASLHFAKVSCPCGSHPEDLKAIALSKKQGNLGMVTSNDDVFKEIRELRERKWK